MMVYCIECQFKGWEHQEANAGLVQELSEICTVPVCVIAEYSHIKVLQQYKYAKKIQWQGYHTACNLAGDEDAYGEYAFFLSRLFHKNKLEPGDRVFFLSSNRALLVVLALLAPVYADVAFYCVMHALLEKVTGHGMMAEQNRLLTLKNAIRLLAVNKNINIIGYSPYTKKCLEKILSPETLRQVFFLHHPVEKTGLPAEKKEGTKMRIALVGAAVNAEGIHIIKRVLGQSDGSGFEFDILDRRNMQQEFHDSRVNVVRKASGFGGGEIQNAIQRADWLLVPYGHAKYQVSASGIFADAIRYEKPVFALDSPYVTYYNKRHPVGYVEQTEEKLAGRICEVAHHCDKRRYGLFVDNIRRTSEEMKTYNKKILSGMVCGDKGKKKKCVLPALAGFAGWVVLKEYGKRVAGKNYRQKIRADKNASVIAVLNQLFMAVQGQKDIAGFLKEKGYEKIAIYGMGNVGCRLYDELKGTDIKVMYGIDAKASEKLKDLKVIPVAEINEEPDAVIITPVFYYSEICAKLREKLHCRLVSIEELLNEMEAAL